MKIYTVIIQSLDRDGHHQNGIETFDSFDKAKKFIDDCIEGQKRLEGEDSFHSVDITGEMYEYGWIFKGSILYGIETIHTKDGPFRGNREKRFVIETDVH